MATCPGCAYRVDAQDLGEAGRLSLAEAFKEVLEVVGSQRQEGLLLRPAKLLDNEAIVSRFGKVGARLATLRLPGAAA